MKVSRNFDIREFVPRSIWNKYKGASTWFINKKIIELAQFYKDFFTKYYKNKLDDVETVLIIVNNWHYQKNGHQYRGFRPISYHGGASLSQHRIANAFDCDIIVVFKGGRKKEADYEEIHSVIHEYSDMFIGKGLSAIESIKDAPTWLHSDCRWIIDQDKIMVVRYRKKKTN